MSVRGKKFSLIWKCLRLKMFNVRLAVQNIYDEKMSNRVIVSIANKKTRQEKSRQANEADIKIKRMGFM